MARSQHTSSVYQWADSIAPKVARAVHNYQVVAIVGKAGTGKTWLARAALPTGHYVDLSQAGETEIDESDLGGTHVIFDEIHAVEPGSQGAEAVLERCYAMEGFIAVFQDESGIEKYLAGHVAVEVFNLDTQTHRKHL